MSVLPAVSPTTVLPVIEVQVVDELDISTVNRLWDQLSEALTLRPNRLIVDLTHCHFIDAQAMTVLLDAHRTAWAQGGRLVLRGCSQPVRRLFSLAGIAGVFSYDEGPDA